MGSIKLCSNCDGEGEKWERYFGDGEMVKCITCKGSGKVYVRTYQLQISYSDKNDKAFYETDSLIINKINELKLLLKNKV